MDSRKFVYAFLFLLGTVPCFAQSDSQFNTAKIVNKMQAQLDLQQNQMSNITSVIDKYNLEFDSLKQSMSQGVMNPSAVQSQWQGIEDQETQELSQYLKPNQLSEWRQMQGQIYQQVGSDDSQGGDIAGTGPGGNDQYTNLPNNNAQN